MGVVCLGFLSVRLQTIEDSEAPPRWVKCVRESWHSGPPAGLTVTHPGSFNRTARMSADEKLMSLNLAREAQQLTHTTPQLTHSHLVHMAHDKGTGFMRSLHPPARSKRVRQIGSQFPLSFGLEALGLGSAGDRPG